MLSGLISLYADVVCQRSPRESARYRVKSVPVNDLLPVEIVACRRQFSGPEADTPLVDFALAFHMDCIRVNGTGPDTLYQIRDQFSSPERNKGRLHSHLKSPPSMRSRTKKQFSSSWNA
jgi:hypothetical protein